jgi:hypothetical protein
MRKDYAQIALVLVVMGIFFDSNISLFIAAALIGSEVI